MNPCSATPWNCQSGPPPFCRQCAETAGVLFLDAGTVIRSGAADGIHLDPEEHRKLAEAAAEII